MTRLIFLTSLLLVLVSLKGYSQIRELNELLNVHSYNIVDVEDYLLRKRYTFKGTKKVNYGREYSFYYGSYPISGNKIVRVLNNRNEVIFTEFSFFNEKDYTKLKEQLSNYSFKYSTTYDFEEGIKHLYSKEEASIDIYIRENAINVLFYTVRIVSDKFRLQVYGNDTLINNKKVPVYDYN